MKNRLSVASVTALVVSSLLLAACPQSYYDHFRSPHADSEFLGERTADESYRSWNVPVETSGFNSAWYRTSHTATFYTKTFDHNGKLAVCGAFTLPDAEGRRRAALSQALSAGNSVLYVGPPESVDTPRVWPGFFGANTATELRQIQARCVVTTAAWRSDYANVPISVARVSKP
jgi:hypothetical protein